MLRFDAWRADVFHFAVTGPGAQRLFGMAARVGIPLHAIRCTADGYAVAAPGYARARLRALAAQNGWQMQTLARRGPGHRLERLLRRPGLAAGAAVFLLLMRLLPGYVWAMDLSGLDTARQQALRTVLAENAVTEGTRLTAEHLQRAQQALSLHSEWFGWLSLNFAGGCLYVENTPLQRQPIADAPQDTALYARAGGLVLAVEVDSGFAAVQPGQYVSAGQLLAADIRPDHDGGPVTQAAAGRITARVEQTYTAAQPLHTEAKVPTGQRVTLRTLHLAGRSIPLQSGEDAPPQDARTQTAWQPLRLGAVALPACLYTVTAWPCRTQTLVYSEDAAAALARRACRLLLAAQFPDAAVEQTARTVRRVGDSMECTARYVFTADIALAAPSRGEAAP